MTTLAQEQAKQRLWRLKWPFAGLRVFDQLLENEFCPAQEVLGLQTRVLTGVVRYAAANTPYYGALLARLGLEARDIDSPDSFAKLPVLTKQEVIQFQEDLRSRALPPGEVLFALTTSSGTTGRPVTVLHTRGSNNMNALLRQRTARWFNLDPMKTRVDVRPPREIARHPDGSGNPTGNIVAWPGWRQLDSFFETGPEHGFNNTNPMEQQVAFLQQIRPHYAMGDPGLFEEWLLANDGRTPVDSLEALMGIGSQLTPSLRARLEKAYGIPIQQAYGLNEIGMVAVRCEAGRYHAHAEHCLVEIVGPDGRRCAAGETGKVVVTALRNPAMPLIRYDTGDLAEAVEGPCPCGRTLPSFGEIAGRFRRYAGLPEGTRERFIALRKAVENCPAEELTFLRRYQVHQDRENRFTLRLRTVKPIPDAFRQAIMRAWEPVAGNPAASLTLAEIEEIPTSPSGKILDFVSDFYSDSYAAPQQDHG